jgi:5-methylcytosine-specific restriction endonuclease McrA
MTSYSLRHLSDELLSTGLDTSATDDRLANATLLAHIAEFDRRGLCAPTQYPSMFRYCVGHLRMSEDMAYKRVRTAKVARMFPGVFVAIADGRLNLSGVTLLSKHLTRANGRELLAAAVNRSRAEIQEMLARRFPATAATAGPASVAADATPSAGAAADAPLLASPPAELLASASAENGREPQQFSPVPGRVENTGVFGAPAPNTLPELQLRVTPIAPGRYELVAVIDQAAHDRLMGSKDLLGHAVPGGALVEVLQRAIALQHEHLRKRRCAATDRPRTTLNGATPRQARNPRQIPAAVCRAVWERDGGRCAYVSADGHRCEARSHLELDHIVPVAKGGESTVENLRLLCREHNRHVAEREFGRDHMKAKREVAQRRRAAERFHKQADRERVEKRRAEIERQREELGEAFQILGYRGAEVERALGCCATRPEAPPEERIKYALSFMPPSARWPGDQIQDASARVPPA